ncbi:glycosyltransferase family 2 protein [Rivularia sp. UHCC 0363]|uniref:glycosyltransferase family 2 protein n=1 Tax=Rivularia sp. UHCC 0363 TaxID=3110244 RepID=UPI002B1F9120|nr:glycosyltransferase family 2 protein [Rivularia sp. UHCC 0363]MEA5598885.1 glycosyltransferase family 2 protein [Rivularia sp. UHCC 0363]
MTAKNDISFVIVSYNSAHTLRGAIESCIKAVEEIYPETGKVIVYDNASKDKCPQILDDFTRRYPEIFIGKKGEQNLGFGAANNRAVAALPSKVYVLINPDVTFKPQIISRLKTTLNSAPDVAIVCPKLLYPDKSVQPSIRRFPTFNFLLFKYLLGDKIQNLIYPFDYYYACMPPPRKNVEINWAIGAFMMVSGKYVERYGLFDERFFLYFEDVSLCVDAWQNGYRVLFQPSASALHLYQRSSTSSKFNYLTLVHMVSALKFFAKYRRYQKSWQLIAFMLKFNLKIQNVWRFLILSKIQKLQQP